MSGHTVGAESGAERQASGPRKRWSGAARFGASIALLAAMAWWVDWREALSLLTGAHPGLLLAVLGLCVADRCLSAYRWHVLIRTQTRSIGFRSVLRLTFLSAFLGNFLPGAVGAEAVRIAGLARSTSDLAGAFSTVLVDRLLGLAALLLIILAVLPLAPADAALPIVVWGGVMIAGTTLGLLALPALARTPAAWRVFRFAPARIAREKAIKLAAALKKLSSRPRTILWASALALLFQFGRILLAPLAALALGLEIPLIYFFVYVPIIVFAAILPFSVGGLGVREAGFVFFFGAGLTTPEAAFALALLISIAGVAASLPGAAVIAVPSGAAPATRPASAPRTAHLPAPGTSPR